MIVPIYVLPTFLIKSSKYVLLILIIKYAVPSFLTGFILYGYSKLFYSRFNMLSEENLHDDDNIHTRMSSYDESVKPDYTENDDD